MSKATSSGPENSIVPLRIDIVSDVVCPWCIIGYKQLQLALGQFADRIAVELHWQPFELNPQMPVEGQNARQHLQQKYGATSEQSRAARTRLVELGESLGFQFNYGEDMRIYNSFSAHQLLHWAGEKGAQTDLKLALFESYFSRGENISDPTVLARVAEQCGLEGEEALAVLADGRYVQSVRSVQREWLDRDVHAVPAIFFQGTFMVPGAQAPDVLVRLIEKVLAKQKTAH